MADDLYGLLGVSKTADADAIKKAYRKLAKQLHPDKNPGNAQAESKFKAVNHAYEVLADPKRRALYDEFGEDGLREGFDPERARAYTRWSSQQGARGGGGGVPGGIDIEDLFGGGGQRVEGFGDVFGDLFGRGRRRGPVRGADLESEITVDLASAIRGTSLELRPQGGAGPPVVVRIPPGADEGSRVRISGQGAPSPGGGPRGDLLLTIHVKPHPFFRREGDDLHLELPITLHEAYFGGKIRVPTIDGSVSLTVPERTQGGTVMRLKGKGVARKGRSAGDLYVHFQVHIPRGDGADLSALFQKLAEHQKEDLRRDIVL